MVIDDIDQLRQKLRQRVAVAGNPEIFLNGMEIPQSGIGRVIQTLVLAFRKHVGNETVLNVIGEGSKDIAGLRRRPVVRVSPSRLIIVSRPQSVNQW